MIVWCHQWHGLLQALKPRFWTAKSYVTSQFLIRVTTFLLLAMTIGKCGFVFNKLPPDPMVYHYFPCSRTCHDLGVCPIVRQSKYHIKLIIWYVYIYIYTVSLFVSFPHIMTRDLFPTLLRRNWRVAERGPLGLLDRLGRLGRLSQRWRRVRGNSDKVRGSPIARWGFPKMGSIKWMIYGYLYFRKPPDDLQ